MPLIIEAAVHQRQRTTSEDSVESSSSSTDHDPQFRPIIQLPEVEVSTNEENETVLLTMRAKLYRFDTSSEPSEWKERGTGEMKLLQHNNNNSVRIVMRRDKTFKVCANHFITPWMELKPCFGSDKAFVYTVAADFADEMPKSECLAIKFGNVDNANLFQAKFEQAKEILLAKCDLYNGKCDDDDDDDEEVDDSETEDEDGDGEEKTKQVTEKLMELNVNQTAKKDNQVIVKQKEEKKNSN